MILVVGGVASGKRSFALSLGYGERDIADGVMDASPVMHHAEKLLGKPGSRSVEELAEALSSKVIVTISDVGAGVVPASAEERAWREEVGCLAVLLAERATCVVRMTCGIPRAVKGELSSLASGSGRVPASDSAADSASAFAADGTGIAMPAAPDSAPDPVSDPVSVPTTQHEYPFITNRACPYFPCHDDIDPDEFNCLFCYCPLYVLGPGCGGRFTYTETGVKNCAGCSIPHRGDAGTKLVQAKWLELSRLAQRE